MCRYFIFILFVQAECSEKKIIIIFLKKNGYRRFLVWAAPTDITPREVPVHNIIINIIIIIILLLLLLLSSAWYPLRLGFFLRRHSNDTYRI